MCAATNIYLGADGGLVVRASAWSKLHPIPMKAANANVFETLVSENQFIDSEILYYHQQLI